MALCRSPDGNTDWRGYPREPRGMVPLNMSQRQFYAGGFPPGIPPMYPPDARFGNGEWRPSDRDYYRSRPQ